MSDESSTNAAAIAPETTKAAASDSAWTASTVLLALTQEKRAVVRTQLLKSPQGDAERHERILSQRQVSVLVLSQLQSTPP